MPNAYMTANGFLSLGLETTRGTAAASPTDIPVANANTAMSPMITWLKDDALRGSPVDQYDAVPGVRADDVDIKGFVYPDSIPILFMAALGSSDNKTGAGPTYTHTIGVANSASTGSQPLSCTAVLSDAANAFQITGAQLVTLDLDFGADKAFDWTAKFTGNPWTNPSIPSTSWGAVPLIPAWNSAISVGGTQLVYVEAGTIKVDRKTAPIYTAGTQSPLTVFAGRIAVTGTLECVVYSNADPFTIGGSAYSLFRQPKACSWVFTEPVNSYTVTITMTDVQFDNPKRNLGKEFTSYSVGYTALANTTDAVASGYAPIKTVTVNGNSAAYAGS